MYVCLKFLMLKKLLNCLCSESEGADQMRGHHNNKVTSVISLTGKTGESVFKYHVKYAHYNFCLSVCLSACLLIRLPAFSAPVHCFFLLLLSNRIIDNIKTYLNCGFMMAVDRKQFMVFCLGFATNY